ncbi:MAG: hypothetical protein E6G47_03205 [Actinobacteria bacterium]|nr:MAG: hypothetical protein E6G47_03205 [Actinomycetota bacterium]
MVRAPDRQATVDAHLARARAHDDEEDTDRCATDDEQRRGERERQSGRGRGIEPSPDESGERAASPSLLIDRSSDVVRDRSGPSSGTVGHDAPRTGGKDDEDGYQEHRTTALCLPRIR